MLALVSTSRTTRGEILSCFRETTEVRFPSTQTCNSAAFSWGFGGLRRIVSGILRCKQGSVGGRELF